MKSLKLLCGARRSAHQSADFGAATALMLSAGCGGDGGNPDASKTRGSFSDEQLVAQKCDLSAAITSYRAGAGASTPSAPARAPGLVPCYQEFGLGSAEAALNIASDGVVTYAPVFSDQGAGLHRSADHGQTWQTVVPTFPDGGAHGRQQPTLFLDPDTDRMFFATTTHGFGGVDTATSTATAGYDMTRSSDGYATYEYSNVAPETSDWMKMYAGPPVTSTTSDYPNWSFTCLPRHPFRPSRPFTKPSTSRSTAA